MVNLTISLSDDTVKKLRRTVSERYGNKKGALSGLIEESVRERLEMLCSPQEHNRSFRAISKTRNGKTKPTVIAEAENLEDLTKKLENLGVDLEISQSYLLDDTAAGCEDGVAEETILNLSGFLDLTPSAQIKIENPLLRKTYPQDDSTVIAVIDTGYQGFLSIPNSIYRGLGLHRLPNEKRKVTLANGDASNTRGCYATVVFPQVSLRVDGFVETFAGLDEILLGNEALAETRLLLDYCMRKIRIEKCINLSVR